MCAQLTLDRRTVLNALSAIHLALIFILSASTPAKAQSPTDNELGTCFTFKFDDGPEMAALRSAEREEIWCYRKLVEPKGTTYIFNIEDGKTHPELSALVYADGSIVHASLLAGEVTVHKILPSNGGFNPLPVPLDAPSDHPRVTMPPSESLSRNAAETLQFLLTEKAEPADLNIKEEEITTLVSSSARPWRGYWWPYREGRLWNGTSSPLAKYDRYVAANSSEKPHAAAWEKKNHPRIKAGGWDGHCNGWAASSILREEPRNAVTDQRSGVRFTVSDIKGLLAVRDSCVKFSFYGKRYRGPRNDVLDINPAEFHRVITYNIGKLGKPVIMDRLSGSAVDNHVVSGYTASIKRLNRTQLSVTMTLTIHSYDKKPIEEPGLAPVYRKTYKYILSEGRDGEIIKGVWRTPNPDFLWVPLRETACRDDDGNPEVTEKWLEALLKG